jgi:hypothetical protein
MTLCKTCLVMWWLCDVTCTVMGSDFYFRSVFCCDRQQIPFFPSYLAGLHLWVSSIEINRIIFFYRLIICLKMRFCELKIVGFMCVILTFKNCLFLYGTQEIHFCTILMHSPLLCQIRKQCVSWKKFTLLYTFIEIVNVSAYKNVLCIVKHNLWLRIYLAPLVY